MRPSVHGKRRFADLAIIGVLLIAVAVLLVRQSDIGKPPPPANPAIAVLPFENLSGNPEQAYFSDGLAVEVLDRLGRVPGLRVIASSSSFSFKGKNQDPRTVAEQLGVTTVLQGSVRRDGRKLKVNAKLIDGTTGFQLWSGSFDREVTDIFAVQAELAAAVIDAIVPAARGDTVAAPPPTTNLDAHDHYLLGLAAQRSRSAPGSRSPWLSSSRPWRSTRPTRRRTRRWRIPCCCGRAIPGASAPIRWRAPSRQRTRRWRSMPRCRMRMARSAMC